MRKEQLAYISIALVLILGFSMFVTPIKAFVNPSGTQNSNYELFGPHLTEMEVSEYGTPTAEFTALESGSIDITDWPLTPTWITTFTTAPYNATTMVLNAGGQNSYYVIDFNLDDQYDVPNSDRAPYVNPAWNGGPTGIPPISTDTYFRIACEDIFNRVTFGNFLGIGGVEIYTPIPAYMSSWIWAGAAGAWPAFSLSQAVTDLNYGDIYNNTGTWYWNYPAYQAGQHDQSLASPTALEYQACVLEMTYRQDANRQQAGQQLSTELTALGFTWQAGFPKSVTGGQNYQIVMLTKNYLITTLGWGSVGPTPDYIYAGYNSANFWDDPSSSCPDESDLHDSVTDAQSLAIHTAPDTATAYTAAIAFQQRYVAIAAEIPLYSPAAYFAESRNYTGPSAYTDGGVESQYVNLDWLGIANSPSVGTDNWFSFLNMYPSGYLYGTSANPEVVRWGWSVSGYPQHLNALYSEWVWDYDILGLIYDSPGYLDPYDLVTWHPDLIENWTVGTWVDQSGTTKSAVTMTLRPDVYWQDGVPLTMADVMFSIVQLGPLLVSKGLPPPWWWPTAETIQSVIVKDPYTVTLLFNVESAWAEGWALGGFYILPEHVWKPLILSGANVGSFAPDVNMIGSGPWRFLSYTAPTALVMVANSPGSTVTTNNVGATAVTSPEGYHNYCPIGLTVNTLAGSDTFWPPSEVPIYGPGTWNDFATRIPIWATTDTVGLTFDVTLYQKLSNSTGFFTNLDGLKNVTVDGTPIVTNKLETLTANTPLVETLGPVTLGIGLHVIKATFVINSPATVVDEINGHTEANPWLGQVITATVRVYVTTPVDIGGSNFYDDIGWTNQTMLNEKGAPYKSELPTADFVVDGSDLAICASAFGSYPGSPRWSTVSDVNHDGVVDGSDLALIAFRFGW